MKINKLHIENYESLRNVDVELSEDINIFIGKNNSGKSNIIDAFMFLSDCVTHGVTGIDSRGGFEEIVFGKDNRNKITFDCEFILSDEDISALFSKLQLATEISLNDFETALSDKIRYIAEFGKDKRLIKEEVYIYFNNNEIIYAKGNWDGGSYMRKLIKDLKEGINNGNWQLGGYGGGRPPTSVIRESVSHSLIHPKEELLLSIHDFLKSFYHLNPVRISSGDQDVLGGIKLVSDGSNLPQVLNTIASKNR